jgi:hypothetical protein
MCFDRIVAWGNDDGEAYKGWLKLQKGYRVFSSLTKSGSIAIPLVSTRRSANRPASLVGIRGYVLSNKFLN